MEPIIIFDDVSKTYSNGVHGLQHISLSIAPGEFVAVIGPSGAGKSTFLRSINQLQTISSGKILIDGEDITTVKGKKLRALRRTIGMIFQNYNLVYRLSVLQNVLHGRLGYMSTLKGMFASFSEEDKQKAVSLLQEIDMGDFLNTRAADLSGGQKQRVGIARAFMQNPKILLCDEPIASLDPSSAKRIMDMIYTLVSRRNITCIVNLHQINAVKEYATRIIGLRQGQLVFDGTAKELDDAAIQRIYGMDLEALNRKEETAV